MKETVLSQAPTTPKRLRLKEVLFALELAQPDRAALAFLSEVFAQIPVQRLSFLHVLPATRYRLGFPESISAEIIEELAVEESVLVEMEGEIAVRFPSVESTLEVRHGDPLQELIAMAIRRNVDLTVIGQNTGTNRHGILAKNVARQISGDALVIPDRTSAQLSRIVVPIDFSENARRALEKAIQLSVGWPQPIPVSVVNVYELPDASVYKISRQPGHFEKMLRENRLEALDQFLSPYAEFGANLEVDLLRKEGLGLAAHILKYTKEQAGDLIVIGAKGHSLVERFFLGSVTEKLVSTNHSCPTWIVK
ncbi:MAG: universal stress protein [Bacteroidota bacterium]